MSSQPNTAIQRMLPRAADAGRLFKSVDGQRSFTAVAGTTVDMAPQDAAEMESNGWFRTGGRDCVGVGTTALRPTDGLYHGARYVDTTLSYVVVYDGSTWRNPVTGASV